MKTEYERYICDKDSLRETLDTYGVAIIPSVLTSTECNKMSSGMWDFFEHITQEWTTPIDRSDTSTWRGIYDLSPLHSQLFQHWNVGHCQASWDIRQKKKIVDIFARLWNCEKKDLLTSFDGFSMCLPPEATNKGWQNKTWFHTDQSYVRNDMECIQSWVTANDVTADDASLAIYEGSHLLHEEFAVAYNKTGVDDWYKFKDDEERFYSSRCTAKKIICPKGSMVFWDSRTIHCGTNPVRSRGVENIRQVIYLCYMPRSLCTSQYLGKKQNYFETMRTCNHWPCKPKAFPKNPRTYGGKLPTITAIDKPVLTPLGLKLAGF